MKNQIINLIISMYRIPSIRGLESLIPKILQHLLRMWYLPDELLSLNIHYFPLCLLYCSKCLDLPVVEARWFAKGFEADLCGVDTVKLGQCSDCIMLPTLFSISD